MDKYIPLVDIGFLKAVWLIDSEDFNGVTQMDTVKIMATNKYSESCFAVAR